MPLNSWLMTVGVKGLGFGFTYIGKGLWCHMQNLRLGPSVHGNHHRGAGGDAHFWTGFPGLKEDLEEEGGPEGPFWPPAGWISPLFLGSKVFFLLLNTFLGSSLFAKELVPSARRFGLQVIGLYMLNQFLACELMP